MKLPPQFVCKEVLGYQSPAPQGLPCLRPVSLVSVVQHNARLLKGGTCEERVRQTILKPFGCSRAPGKPFSFADTQCPCAVDRTLPCGNSHLWKNEEAARRFLPSWSDPMHAKVTDTVQNTHREGCHQGCKGFRTVPISEITLCQPTLAFWSAHTPLETWRSPA